MGSSVPAAWKMVAPLNQRHDQIHEECNRNCPDGTTCDSLVEEVIDTCPLLQELDGTSENGSVHQFGDARRASGDTLHPGSFSRRLLHLDRLSHLLHVLKNVNVLHVVLATSKAGRGEVRALPVSLSSEPTGAVTGRSSVPLKYQGPIAAQSGDSPLRCKHDADSERQGEEDADADDDSPRGVAVFDRPRAIVDQVGDKDTDGDQELVRGCTDQAVVNMVIPGTEV
jgi:hypothetical protein